MVRKLRTTTSPVPPNEVMQISANVTKFGETMDLLRTIIKYGCCLGMVYFICKAIVTLTYNLSGRTTIANIGINLSFVWPTATALASCWAIGEKKSKGNHIKKLSEENKELKKIVDKNVGSSSLKSNGETREEDKIWLWLSQII